MVLLTSKDIAQVVERWIFNLLVAGSSPVVLMRGLEKVTHRVAFLFV